MADKPDSSGMEDVLTSVKRLVTHGAATGPETDAEGSDPSDLIASEKLLLTPSLRVGDEEDEAGKSEPAAEAPFEDVPETPRPSADVLRLGARTNRAELEGRIAELEAAVGASPEEWEPDGSEAVDTETPHRFVFTHTPRAPDDTPPETEAEAEAAGPDVAPHGDADLDRAVENTARFTVSEAVSRAVRVAVTREAGEEPAPDLPAGDDAAATAIHAGGADLSEPVELASDLMIDEDMLRDIVSEIVRQELQGALGERITRNVRKLVRREIHRAIMTRDFG